MGLTEEKKQWKRASLMDSAFRLFTTQGVSKTSIEDIAKAAGVAKGTFYLYFKDKYDLVGYIFDGENIIIKNKCRTTESFFAEIKEYLDFLHNKKHSFRVFNFLIMKPI